jgi:hypothetical protein
MSETKIAEHIQRRFDPIEKLRRRMVLLCGFTLVAIPFAVPYVLAWPWWSGILLSPIVVLLIVKVYTNWDLRWRDRTIVWFNTEYLYGTARRTIALNELSNRRKMSIVYHFYSQMMGVEMEPPEPRETDLAGLSNAVTRELARLGATFVSTPTNRIEIKLRSRVSRQMLQFVEQYQWPKGSTYKNGENLWAVDFLYNPLESCDEFPGCKSRKLFMIGIADGGNYILATAADDPFPSDPAVYVVNHDGDADGALTTEYSLSGLLSSLHSESSPKK